MPPGEETSPLLASEPVIFKILDKFKEVPLIGLEYIVEVIHGPSTDPTYECLLCNTKFDSSGVVSDVVSAFHRLKYLVSSQSCVWMTLFLNCYVLTIAGTVLSHCKSQVCPSA